MPRLKGLLGKGSVMATVPNTTGIAVGAHVSGLGIVPGTTVAEIRGPEAVQLSQGATDTVIDAELVFEDMSSPKPVETIDSAFSVFDRNGNGKPGGSKPKAKLAVKVAAKPVAKKAAPKPAVKKPAAKRVVTTATRKKK